MKTRNLLIGLTTVAASAGVVAAGTTTFRLHDHPGGNANPPPYGLRLDNLFGTPGDDTTTFSFNQGGASVLLTVNDDNPSAIRIRIFGTVYGGVVNTTPNPDIWINPQLYQIDFTFRDGVVAAAGGWHVADSPGNSNTGSISGPGISGSQGIIDIHDDLSNTFYFRPDGHRLPGDNSTWVGRGWLTYDGTGRPVGDTQDWLFTGELIPLPGSAAMAGLGLLGVAGLRRRRM